MRKVLGLLLSTVMAFTFVIMPVDAATTVTDASELQTAINNGEKNIVIADNTVIDASNVDFSKADGAVIRGNNSELDFSSGITGSNITGITFENLTITRAQSGTYKGFTHTTDESYVNCTIKGEFFVYGQSASFRECTFIQTSANSYNIWTYAADVDFVNCTFESAGKSALVYNEGVPTTVTYTGCEFNASSKADGKAAIEIGTEQFSDSELENGVAFNVVIKDCTAEGFDEGNNSGNTLWNNKTVTTATPGVPGDNVTITVDDELVLYDGKPLEDYPIIVTNDSATAYYLTLAEAITNAEAGDTIVLLDDVTLTTKFNVQKDVTIDLNENTLTLTATDNDVTGTNGVEIINGTISLDPVNSAGDGIIRIGVRGNTNGGSLTLTDVIVEGENISSGAGTVVVYSNGEFNMNTSELNLKDEDSSAAYMIYANDGKAATINITESKIIGTNVNSGIFNGTVTIENSVVDLETKDNGINQNENGLDLSIIDSEIEISGGNGRALTLYGDECKVTITNSTLIFAENTEADIRYKTAATGQIVVVDINTVVSFGTVKIDGNDNATAEDVLATMKLPTCGNIEVDEETDMYGLVFNHKLDLVGEKEATCTEEGYTGDTVCEVCEEILERGEVIAKVAHKEVMKDAKKATCTEEGYTGDIVCEVCEEILEHGEVIAKVAHKEVVTGTKEATCTTEGYTGDTVCEVCEEVLEKGKTIEKTAHTYKDGNCTVCNAEDPNYVSNKTGDTNLIVPFAGAMLVSAAVLVLLKKKEELMK